jgi:iron complex outermembrane receptor protein
MRKQVGCLARVFIKFGVQVYAPQDRFYGAYGTETYTPGYTLLDAGLGGDIVNKSGRTLFTLTVLGTNLADIGYQSNMNRLKYFDDHPVNGTGRSGIYNMGRNVSLKLVVPFDLKKTKAG